MAVCRRGGRTAVTSDQGGPVAGIRVRRPASRGWARRSVRRALGGLAVLTALTGLVITGTPGGSAIKPAVRSASAPAPRSALASAPVGPGLLPPPRSVAYTNAQVCGAVASKGGFSYNTDIRTNAGSYPIIVVAVAVALAESGCQYHVYLCNPSLAQGYYPPVSCPAGTGSYDRGLWQVNSYYQSDVSDACAFQVQCNTAAAFRISDKGRNWSAWTSYNSGAWARYISLAEQSVYGFSFLLQNHGTGTCLDADSRQPHDGGKIFQWRCSHSDKYQQWAPIGTVGNLPILRNAGTGTCLDADSRQPHDRGKIFQWRCRTTDPYQQWWFHGSGQLNVNGNANAVLHSQGTRTTCLDGDSRQPHDRGKIFQWLCNRNDYFQQWN
jgi:Lysozyme like domain/Ricin-type beta-trefoil lectin domain